VDLYGIVCAETGVEFMLKCVEVCVDFQVIVCGETGLSLYVILCGETGLALDVICVWGDKNRFVGNCV